MVRLDNGARDGQPHPHAFRLAGEKRLLSVARPIHTIIGVGA
jgi:hypothetical protein